MKFAILGLVAAVFLFAYTNGAPAKSGATCSKACPFNYSPICASPQNGKGADLSFGNDCVLSNYNCEHADAPYTMKAKGECPGSTGIRLQ